MKPDRKIGAVVAMLVAMGAIACSDPTLTDVADPAFNHASTPIERHVILCKDGSSADFSITNGTVATASLADGDCVPVASHPGDNSISTHTITETATPLGFVLDHVDISELGVAGNVLSSHTEYTPAVTVTLHDDVAVMVEYYNIDIAAANGRMTGGNNIRVGQVRLTGGLTIHCDITLSNNIEVNWPGGNKWHLDKPITAAVCIDDPQYDPTPPAAPFNTFIGEGIGSLNGVDGSFIRFTFIDDGEPGTGDHASIDIWAPGADPSTDPPVLSVSEYLTHGNIQAHYDQPHFNH